MSDINFFTKFMNKEALTKRMSKMNVKDSGEELDSINLELMNIKDTKKKGDIKLFPKKELIKFTHGIYGTITAGGYKGYEVEVKEFIPEKLIIKLENGKKITISRNMVKISKFMKATIKKGKLKGKSGSIIEIILPKVRVLVNNKPEIIYAEDLFYHDILLQDDTIANVIKIERDGNIYKYYIKTLKKGNRNILQKDIKLYLLGFRVNTGEKEEEKEEVVEQEFVDDTISDIISETESSLDYGEEDEEDEDLREEGEVYKAAYTDIERVGRMTEKLIGKRKESYNLVKKILELNNENESSINIYKVLDELSEILKYISNKLMSLNINFDIYKSNIDRKMILCILTAYEMISSEDVNFTGVNIYIKTLYDNDFFKLLKLKDSVLVNTDIFECKIGDDKDALLDISNIRIIMACYHNIIKRLLNKDIDLEKIEDHISDIDLELIVPKIKEYKKFKTIDELLENNIQISYKDLISGKYDGKILLGAKFDKCLNIYKDNLKQYIQNKTLSKLQKYLYEFIYDNLMNIEEIRKLEAEVIGIISSKFSDFNDMYNKCKDNEDYFDVDICKENVIISYIANYTSDNVGDKGSMEDLKMLLKYKEFIRLSKEFMIFLKNCYSESKLYQSEKISEIRGKLESIKRKRDLEYYYDEKKNEWIKKQKE